MFFLLRNRFSIGIPKQVRDDGHWNDLKNFPDEFRFENQLKTYHLKLKTSLVTGH